MDKNEIGNIIKTKREEENITQEELCIGICSASTLSRIESGSFNSNHSVLTRLLERLGLSADYLKEAVSDEDYLVRQKIRDINRTNISGDKEKARTMLDNLGKDYDDFSVENKQRYDVIGTKMLFEDGKIDAWTMLDHLEDSLRMTIPNYNENDLPKHMTNMEAQILRDIGSAYGVMEMYESAIAIHKHIKAYIERNAVDKFDSAKKLIVLCYNLSKFLGLIGRYDESIQVAEEGVDYCQYTRDMCMLPNCMYNCAWSLKRRNCDGDKEEAKKLAEEALSLCTPKVYNTEQLLEHLKELLNEIYCQ